MFFQGGQSQMKNYELRILFWLVVFFNFLLWFFFWLKIQPSAELVPLHYNIYTGFDIFGPWQDLFFLPEIGSVIGVVNSILAYAIFPKERSFSVILLGGALLAQIFLLGLSFFIFRFVVG